MPEQETNDPESGVFCNLKVMRDDKNIRTTELEGITNPFYGNQFMGYFLKIPQMGHYSVPETKSLRGYYIDRINESIRSIATPGINVPSVGISYFGHQKANYNGIGDGELGMLGVTIKLDRYLNNYTAFVNWSYIKYDWTFGHKNKDFSQMDLEGVFVLEFIDGEENISRKIKYKIWIEDVPSINLATTSPEEMDITIMFKVTEIDPSEFVEGNVLADLQKM